MTAQFWAKGEPSNNGGDEDCVVILSYKGWQDRQCNDEKFGVLCQSVAPIPVIIPQIINPAVINPLQPNPGVIIPQLPNPAVISPLDPNPAVLIPQLPNPAVISPLNPNPAVLIPQLPNPAEETYPEIDYVSES